MTQPVTLKDTSRLRVDAQPSSGLRDAQRCLLNSTIDGKPGSKAVVFHGTRPHTANNTPAKSNRRQSSLWDCRKFDNSTT
jgi:hypothetical protein